VSRLVVGLGNPGAPYAESRHNLGFRVVEELARRFGCPLDGSECNSRLGKGPAGVTLAEPQTYMNRSGWAVRCLVERHGFEPPEILVVYDEVHLPLGRLRLKPGGSPGGHRGLESVVENLRTDRVPRLRVGCAGAGAPEPGEALSEYVLAAFDDDEREAARSAVERAADACEAWWTEGIDVAMNRFN
jgi:PTH1 family peptidyl-tRNA hydrolase